MKKRFTFLIAALMLLVFMTPSLAGWGQTYTLATSIAVGDEVVLVNAGVAKELSGVTTSGTTYGSVVDVTDSNPTGVYPLTVEAGNTTGSFALKTPDNTYLSWSSGNSLTTTSTVSNSSSWTISISNTIATITNVGTTERKLQYNPGNSNTAPRFACYKSTMSNGKLYKRSGPTKLSTPTNFKATPGNGEATFTWDAVEQASSYTISYTPAGGDEATVTGITGTSRTITGLTNGTEYTCKIKAVGDGSNYSDSEYSSSETVTPTNATSYAINITSQLTGGSVTASAATATAGTTITLTATPSAGYTFNNIASNWTITPVVTINPGANNTATFEMPASDVTVGATFAAMAVYYVSCTTPANGTLSVSPTSGYNGVEVTITATPNSGYELATLTATDSEGQITITDNKFSIRNSNVTVTATFTLAAEWVETSLAELTTDDIFVIVGNNGSNYAMTNDKGTSNPPVASAVTITNGKLTSTVADNIKWNISGNSTDGYTFYPNGSTTTWLYCTDTNNGVRVGTNASKTFKINKNYLQHQGTSRYVGVYSSQDWRCYSVNEPSSHNNIGSQTFAFYKRTVPSSVATPTFSVAEGTYNENQSVTITCATDGATIYYTLDGTKPTSSSTTYTGAITIDETKTLKAIAIKNNEESYVASATYTLKCATPTFSPVAGTYTSVQNVTISCTSPEVSIYYTLDGTTPTSSSTLYNDAINVGETKTIKAIAIKSNWTESEIASATYTINLPLTTMDAIFADATAHTSVHDVYITFNNWVVTGVSGSAAYLTDGTKGCKIWESGHGFSVGNILNGTVQCKLQLYSGASEITKLTLSTTGLTVTTGGTITPVKTTIDALGPVNLGAPITLVDVTYTSSNTTLADGAGNTIKPYSTLCSYASYVADGKTYDFTGIFDYQNAKRILPRGSDDIVLKADLDITADLTSFSYIVTHGPSDEQSIGVVCTDLGSNKLTAAASSDYEVSLTTDGTYTESVEMTPEDGGVSANVYVRLKVDRPVGEHNGTVTFTADNLTTMTVNLEGLVSNAQTYAIDLTQPTGGIATISSDFAVAEEGETITLSYSDLDDCYTFTGWTVLDGNADYVTVNNNQFEMPASAVVVEGIFTQKNFTVDYSVNGTVYEALKTTGIVCGSAVTLKTAADLTAESITLPTGYSFTGWSTSAGSSETISSFTPDADATLYAVLIPSVSAGYVKVTSLQDITEGTYFIVNDGYVLPNADATNAGPVKSNDYKITTPLSDSYSNLPVAGTEWTFTGTNTAMTIMNSATEHYLYVAGTSNNNQLRVNAINPVHSWSFALNGNGTGFSMKDNTNSRYCATYASGSDWRSYASANHSNYGDDGVLYLYKKETPATYTRIEEITATDATLPSIEPTYLITVKDGGVLTLEGPNNGDASNLIIEDGGKLITHSTGVQATVEKDITGAGDENWAAASGADSWYFIASPVDDASFSTATVDDYDLYLLDWANNYWRNLKNNENEPLFANGFQRGTGYLYASKDGNTISVAGEIQPLSSEDKATVTLATTGWNLIGNPLTCKVTVDHEFGLLNNGSSVDYKGTTVNPFQGIVVYGNANELVTFTKAESQAAAAPSNSNSLQMSLAKKVTSRGEVSTKVVDNAVVSFNNSKGMPKFNMLGGNAKLYIPQNNEEYAVVFSDRQGDVPLYFKANETGTYTISFAGDEMSLNGIYLIDILAEEEIDLSVNPSYTFIGSPADRMARFKIVFRNANGDGTSDIFAYQNGNDIIVSGEGELQIFDVMGRMVSRQRVNGVETVNAMPYGVYIFKLNGMTQKIVVR